MKERTAGDEIERLSAPAEGFVDGRKFQLDTRKALVVALKRGRRYQAKEARKINRDDSG